MNRIEIKILNPEVIAESEKMMVCAARLTQRGHKVKTMDDFMYLYEKEYNRKTVDTMVNLPHPTIQKFGAINVVIVGASRRFLAQITRHQNEVKFMSASLQYSDYSGESDFVVPYSILEKGDNAVETYLSTNEDTMIMYESFIKSGYDNDTAGYIAPQGLRNILIISATPYQWKHMISQRTCRRNTDETRYVMLRIWEQLYALSPMMFKNAGPFCWADGICKEGSMTCGKPMKSEIVSGYSPASVIDEDFPLLRKINH